MSDRKLGSPELRQLAQLGFELDWVQQDFQEKKININCDEAGERKHSFTRPSRAIGLNDITVFLITSQATETYFPV